jgi:uncharacterized RDD family membrane protein YckC
MRLLAFTIDVAIVLMLSSVCFSLFGEPDYNSVSEAMQLQQAARGTADEAQTTKLVLDLFEQAYRWSLLIYVGYELLSQAALRGSTVGKRICGLRVIPFKASAAAVHIARATFRTLVKTLFIYLFNGLPFLISSLTLFTNNDGRAGLDFLAGTAVGGTREPKRENN